MTSDVNNCDRVATYFENNWDRYKQAVHNNVLYHDEMFAALNQFLSTYPKHKNLTIADIGCGDSTAILPVLIDKPIKRYIGIDAAASLLEKAKIVLAQIHCEKQFICADMGLAIKKLSSPVHIIVCSFALHHLSYDNKATFIKNCFDKLENNGSFILIDGVLAPNQNRDAWLKELEQRIINACKDITPEEVEARLEHPRKDDFPDSIATFKNIAQLQGWKNFTVTIDKGMFAFMTFTKG